MEKANYSGLTSFKGQNDINRTDAIELQYPDDWEYAPLFGLEKQQITLEKALSPFKKLKLPDKIMRILPKGVILFGPPGTGKTTIVRNISKKLNIPLLIMRADKILNLYLGESEKRVAEVFTLIRDLKKVIIFIDDGETLFPRRDLSNAHHTFRTMEQVLFSEIDQLNPSRTQILIATNQKDMLDPALISRVSLTLEFNKPTKESILAIIDDYLKVMQHDQDILSSKEIICEKLTGLDGREIVNLIGSALCNSIYSNKIALNLDDLLVVMLERGVISLSDVKLIKELSSVSIPPYKTPNNDPHYEINKEVDITFKLWGENNVMRLASSPIQGLGKQYLLLLPFLNGKNAKESYTYLQKKNTLPIKENGKCVSPSTHAGYITLFKRVRFLKSDTSNKNYVTEFYFKFIKEIPLEILSKEEKKILGEISNPGFKSTINTPNLMLFEIDNLANQDVQSSSSPEQNQMQVPDKPDVENNFTNDEIRDKKGSKTSVWSNVNERVIGFIKETNKWDISQSELNYKIPGKYYKKYKKELEQLILDGIVQKYKDENNKIRFKIEK